MNHLWLDYEHENETIVNPKDRMALEGLTGKIPILLRAPGAVGNPRLSACQQVRQAWELLDR